MLTNTSTLRICSLAASSIVGTCTLIEPSDSIVTMFGSSLDAADFKTASPNFTRILGAYNASVRGSGKPRPCVHTQL